MRYILAIVSSLAAANAWAAPWQFEDGHGAEYWDGHALIYATVEKIKRQDIVWSMGVISTPAVVRPLGVLSGVFDAAASPELSVDLSRDGGGRGPSFPTAGDAILLVVVDCRYSEFRRASGGYAAADGRAKYLPNVNAQFAVAKGFSDRAISETFAKVQKLRKDYDRSPVPVAADRNTLALYPHLLVMGEITSLPEAPTVQGGRDKIAIRGVQVCPAVAGNHEPRIFEAITNIQSYRSKFKLPRVGTSVLVDLITVERNGAPHFFVLAEPVTYMPVDHSPIYEIKRVDDPNIAQTIFWRTHCLLYAEILDTRSPTVNKGPGTIVVRPRLTLSGQFDPAKNPEATVLTDAKILESQFHILYSGCYALVVLTRSGDSYSITADPTPFMPGDHGPICWVKSFEDRAVQDTLTAVQKLRHATDETKPKNEPVKQ